MVDARKFTANHGQTTPHILTKILAKKGEDIKNKQEDKPKNQPVGGEK